MTRNNSLWLATLVASVGATSPVFAQPASGPEPGLSRGVNESLPPVRPGTTTSIPVNALPESTQRALILLDKEGADRDGFHTIEATESAVGMLDEALMLSVSALQVRDLVVVPDNIAKTRFANLQFIGYVPEGPGLDTTRVSRLFRDQRGALIMLTEWDYKAAGGGIVAFTDFQKQQVNGAAAGLALLRASSGAALWKLVWTTEKKDYELYVSEPKLLSDQLRERKSAVLEYAKSLGQ